MPLTMSVLHQLPRRSKCEAVLLQTLISFRQFFAVFTHDQSVMGVARRCRFPQVSGVGGLLDRQYPSLLGKR